jgi:hypothetical protein
MSADIIIVHVLLKINLFLFSVVLPTQQENISTLLRNTIIHRKIKSGKQLKLIVSSSQRDKVVELYKEIQKIF